MNKFNFDYQQVLTVAAAAPGEFSVFTCLSVYHSAAPAPSTAVQQPATVQPADPAVATSTRDGNTAPLNCFTLMQHIRNNPGPGPYGKTFGATENQLLWNDAMKHKVAPEEPVFKKINATWPIRKQQRDSIQSLVHTTDKNYIFIARYADAGTYD